MPETPAADDSDLFDRITALPQDAPVSERREARRDGGRGLILVLAAVIAALLASTAFAISQWIGGDLVEPPVTRQEYFDAQKQLVLPPGVVWPNPDVAPDDNSVTTRGGGGGRAVLIAMNAWECYWVDAIDRGDAAAGQRAHVELKRLLANNVFEAPAGAPEDWVPLASPHRAIRDLRPRRRRRLDPQDLRARGRRPPARPRPELPRERSGHRPRTMKRGPAQRGLFSVRTTEPVASATVHSFTEPTWQAGAR